MFINNTFYNNYRGYVQRLMSSTAWNDPNNIIRTSANNIALDGKKPARVRTRTTTIPYLTLYKEGSGSGWSNDVPVYVNVTVSDAAVYDWSLGRYNNDWLGGPFHSYSLKRYVSPSARVDHHGNPYDVPVFLGGPGKFWWTDREVISVSPYAGTVFGTSKVSSIPMDMVSLFQYADSLIQGARNSSDPGKAQHDFGQSLVELRDLPHLLKTAGDNIIAKGSSAFLSYQFAVLPLIGDLRALYHTANNLRKQITFLRDNQGQVIKRKRPLFKLTGVPVTTRTLTYGADPTYGTAGPKAGTYSIQDKYEVEAWYSSKLQFRLKLDLPKWDWNPEAVAILTGLKPNFYHLWELTPWTWLIDWFSNIGDLVQATWGESVTQNQILSEWICITAKTESFLELPILFREKSGSQAKPAGVSSCRTVQTVKARQVPSLLTPLYFGLDSILSRTQQAILAALLGSRIRYRDFL